MEVLQGVAENLLVRWNGVFVERMGLLYANKRLSEILAI